MDGWMDVLYKKKRKKNTAASCRLEEFSLTKVKNKDKRKSPHTVKPLTQRSGAAHIRSSSCLSQDTSHVIYPSAWSSDFLPQARLPPPQIRSHSHRKFFARKAAWICSNIISLSPLGLFYHFTPRPVQNHQSHTCISGAEPSVTAAAPHWSSVIMNILRIAPDVSMC